MNASTDMRSVIVPKSDQKNADDLLAGPITITIRDVSIRPGTEQPVSIHFDGDDGKPWKPCKSMSRVLVAAWGPDANKYIGRSATLYCDPKVKWGGMQVGGIRVSHLSHIEREMMMALTETKGKRAPFVVKPLAKAAVSPLAEKAAATARLGTAAFREFWAALPKPDRATLQPNLSSYQSAALAADSQTGDPAEAARETVERLTEALDLETTEPEPEPEPEPETPETTPNEPITVTALPLATLDSGGPDWRTWVDAAKRIIPTLPTVAHLDAWLALPQHVSALRNIGAGKAKALAGEIEAVVVARRDALAGGEG